MPTFKPEDLASWSGGAWTIDPAPVATGVCMDSRNAKQGDLFVALRGEQVDGHDYVEAALARGAVAALVDRDFATCHPDVHPLLAVEDVTAALTALARGYRQTWRAVVVGITGSVGKTTVKELLADMLTRHGSTARTLGNWNNDLGLPLSMLAADNDIAFGVFEVGMNRPGEIAALSAVLQPTHAVMTPIGPAHMEAFADERAVAEEKADLVRALPANGVLVLSRDEPWFDLLAEETAGRVVTTSMKHEADLYRRSDDESLHSLVVGRPDGEDVCVDTPLPGDFFRSDVLLAAAMARELGVAWAEICRAVRDYRAVGMRWHVEQVAGVTVINDAYNANPMSMQQALRACAEEATEGSRWLVLGSMLELGDQADRHHFDVGRWAADVPSARLVAVGSWAETMDQGALAGGMRAECIHQCDTCEQAAELLACRVVGGDVLLVKASRGARLEQVIEGWKARRRTTTGCVSET